jgi:tetraacyldisaccharide 4'-kinase
VADSNRQRAIKRLLEQSTPEERPSIILLDDAFQHRKVTPTLSILLVDSSRMIHEDRLLPVGNLREPASAKSRANIVIVTKCSEKLKPIDYRLITKNLNLFPYQTLFFTTQAYEDLKPVFAFEELPDIPVSALKSYDHVLLVTGIATPQALQTKMFGLTQQLTGLSYPDHYDFKEKDIHTIEETFNGLKGDKKLIVVTEKDAMRLMAHNGISENIRRHLYYLPVKIRFVQKQESLFEKKITDHINNLRGDKILI